MPHIHTNFQNYTNFEVDLEVILVTMISLQNSPPWLTSHTKSLGIDNSKHTVTKTQQIVIGKHSGNECVDLRLSLTSAVIAHSRPNFVSVYHLVGHDLITYILLFIIQSR